MFPGNLGRVFINGGEKFAPYESSFINYQAVFKQTDYPVVTAVKENENPARVALSTGVFDCGAVLSGLGGFFDASHRLQGALIPNLLDKSKRLPATYLSPQEGYMSHSSPESQAAGYSGKVLNKPAGCFKMTSVNLKRSLKISAGRPASFFRQIIVVKNSGTANYHGLYQPVNTAQRNDINSPLSIILFYSLSSANQQFAQNKSTNRLSARVPPRSFVFVILRC